jgi:hypothetical protein
MIRGNEIITQINDSVFKLVQLDISKRNYDCSYRMDLYLIIIITTDNCLIPKFYWRYVNQVRGYSLLMNHMER